MTQTTVAKAESTAIPAELRVIPRWFPWKRGATKPDGSFDKIPLDRSGKPAGGAGANDEAIWSTFDDARSRAPAGGGVGFVFRTAEDGIAGVDLDGCRDPRTGELSADAREIVDEFASYTEISPSGTGVKIFARGAPANLLPARLSAKLLGLAPVGGKRPGIELFCGWWFTVTGDALPGSSAEMCTVAEPWVRLKQRIDTALAVARQHGGGALRAAAGRNDALYRHLCGLRARGFGEEAIRAAARAENRNRDSRLHENFADGPLPDAELDVVIRQALKRPLGSAIAKRSLAQTDLGNGARLIAYHGEEMLYCYAWKRWLIWDGARFAPDDGGVAFRRAKDAVLGMYEEAAALDEEDGNKLRKHAMESQKRPRLEAMIWAAQAELAVKPEELDRNPNLLNLVSGTLDLATVTVREHRMADRITKLAPVAHDGDTTCPLWLAFLDRIFAGDAELIAFMQRAVGYTLTGSTVEQVFFLLWGTGSNGKTVFLKIVAALLGDYATPVRVGALLATDRNAGGGPNEDVADLIGVRFAYALEPDAQFQLNEALIKHLTGSDTIKARRLHQQLFEFEPTHKLWLAANHPPRIRGVDHGIWRRVMLVPFEVKITEAEKDKHLEEKLRAELPGILVWAMRGLAEYKEGGLAPPAKVIAATRAYREGQDRLAQFIAAELELGPGLTVPVAAMKRAYLRFVGDVDEAYGPRTFNAMLEERGLRQGSERIDGEKTRVWVGARLRAGAGAGDPRPGDGDLPF